MNLATLSSVPSAFCLFSAVRPISFQLQLCGVGNLTGLARTQAAFQRQVDAQAFEGLNHPISVNPAAASVQVARQAQERGELLAALSAAGVRPKDGAGRYYEAGELAALDLSTLKVLAANARPRGLARTKAAFEQQLAEWNAANR